MSAPVVKKNMVEQTIELKDLFRGVDIESNRDLKEYVGEAIIDYIRERTLNGRGMSFSGDRPSPVTFKKYSKEYTESDDFKAFGKSKSEVNLKLTGDMLGLMSITKVDKDSITIGWDDDDQIPKAYNHITGDTVPARPFFGINASELKEIVKTLRPQVRQADRIAKAGTQDDLRSFLQELRDELADGEN